MSEPSALYRTAWSTFSIDKVTERDPADDGQSRPALFVNPPVPDAIMTLMVARDDDGSLRMLLNFHRRGKKRGYAQMAFPPEIAQEFFEKLFREK